MALRDDLGQRIDATLLQDWSMRDGRVVPRTENIVLAGGGVELTGTMLFADLADSTELAMWDRRVTARVCKAFLSCTTSIIAAEGGEVRSFDGDRVMGVFLGDTKNTSAMRCALKINWMFLNLLKPKFEARYASLRDGTYKLAHTTGVDTSEILVVRTGVRDRNDLIWVGQAPNAAAKLSAIRDAPYFSFVSKAVFDAAAREAKISNNGQEMWEARSWNTGPIKDVYRSSWQWQL